MDFDLLVVAFPTGYMTSVRLVPHVTSFLSAACPDHTNSFSSASFDVLYFRLALPGPFPLPKMRMC